MKLLGIIPARGGSIRLPGKNLIDLGGKPLLAWTIEAAKLSRVFHRLVVSTDIDAITDVALAMGTEVIRRPAALADDGTDSLSVVRHAAAMMKDQRAEFDATVLLQPTSPFRTVQDVQACRDILGLSGADAVVSVTEPPKDLVFELGHAGRMRPAMKQVVVPNGALYALTVEAMEQGHDWYSGVTYAYHMPKERSLDIDTYMDLTVARLALAMGAAA